MQLTLAFDITGPRRITMGRLLDKEIRISPCDARRNVLARRRQKPGY